MTSKLLALIQEIEDTYEKSYERVNVLDFKQQDILHELENGKFNACKGYQYAKELKEIRNERRELKNQNLLLKPLYDYLNTSAPFKAGLRKVMSEIDKTENKMSNEYVPRVDKNEKLTTMGETMKKAGFK